MFGSLLKGWLDEKVTQFGLWHHLDEQVYRRFHDVIVPARNGTTQIDHVLVPCYGIFVVELRTITVGFLATNMRHNGPCPISERNFSFKIRYGRISATPNVWLSTSI